MLLNQNKSQWFVKIICCVMLFFNMYYFFIRRGVWPGYYLKKIIYQPMDNIVSSELYRDLSEQYSYMNKMQRSKVNVFVGDSITKRFNVQEFFKDIKILNRGIYFDTTHGLLNRIKSNINNLKIKKLFVMIGYNDLKYRTNDEIINNIKSIIQNAEAEKIFIQSLLPVDSERIEINERIVFLNKRLKRIATRSEGLEYVDLYSHFYNGRNGIKVELTNDGIHPNYFGYNLWYSHIKYLIK